MLFHALLKFSTRFLFSQLFCSGGDYSTLVKCDLSAFTLILETLSAGRCSQSAPPGPQTLTFEVLGGLPGPGTPLAVWRTNSTSFFMRSTDVSVGEDGTFTVSIAPNEMVTVTTLVTAGHHGQPVSPIPPSAPFPLPYADDMNGYPYDAQARYLADQYGSFAVRNGTLQQESIQPCVFVNASAFVLLQNYSSTLFFHCLGLIHESWEECMD